MRNALTLAGLLIFSVSLDAQVTGKDIIITSLSASPTTVAPGKSTSLSYRVYNQGTQMITESYFEKVYLSTNTTFDSLDKYLVASLTHTTDIGANGGYLSVSGLSVPIPSTTTEGTYYLIVRGDASNLISEASETNNDRYIKITVSSTLTAPTEEANKPLLLSTGLTSVTLNSGTNYFKFEVEPGYYYSFIVNSGYYYDNAHYQASRGAPAVLAGYTGSKFQAISLSTTFARCKSKSTSLLVPEQDNPSYAKSATMFFADPNYYSGRYYNYVYVISDGPASSPSYIKIIKSTNKSFGAPFTGPISYYNSFRHRADIDSSGYCTSSGHNGIDIQPLVQLTDSFDVDFNRPILPLVSGEIVRSSYLGKNSAGKDLDYAIWIYNSTLGYTVVYAHVQSPSQTTGTLVTKGVTKLGTISTVQKHLHIEFLSGKNTTWYDGYQNSSPNLDPLPILFEK
jgi:murein DD-endopeptidase MepM/ murein hydrolase activator NlpD